MLICDPWPLDQHYATTPGDLYNQPDDALTLDLNNDIVLEGHLQCAADELPLHAKDDQAYFGTALPQICSERLEKDSEGFYHCHARYKPFPAKHVPIRATEEDSHYSVVDVTDGRYYELEQTEYARALFEVYEGAIFLHQGRSFLVQNVNHESRLVKVAETNVDWSTRQR